MVPLTFTESINFFYTQIDSVVLSFPPEPSLADVFL